MSGTRTKLTHSHWNACDACGKPATVIEAEAVPVERGEGDRQCVDGYAPGMILGAWCAACYAKREEP